MKKFTVLVALALLAATGTSYAVTCSYDNVPGATLLVPYFKVARNGATVGGADIPEGGVDTLVAITNVSKWGVIAHVTVWNKQSAAVLDFNVPMTGYDVATFRMKDILNGKLNVNPNTQKLVNATSATATTSLNTDPCKAIWTIGSTQITYQRFTNPDTTDRANSIAFYATPAFGGTFRQRVWDSLDESADYTSLVSQPDPDIDNPACGYSPTFVDGYAGDFTGYLTIDVVNYCTNFFPNQAQFYTLDAIATLGWYNALENNTPNVLMGDVFFIDPAAAAGNISGDVAISLEFDSRLDWTVDKTFYNRYEVVGLGGGPINDTGGTGLQYQFVGDGREPLGDTYAFRFLNDSAAGLQTWVTVWRSDLWFGLDYDSADDLYLTLESDLCGGPLGYPYFDDDHAIGISTWDNDENTFSQGSSGPSGDIPVENIPHVWWESQRINIAGNSDMNPGNYKFGWSRWYFTPNPLLLDGEYYNQAYVGVMHTAPGAFVSVGFPATLIDNDFTCPGDVFTVPGNWTYRVTAAQ
jgi:hypothetical protein